MNRHHTAAGLAEEGASTAEGIADAARLRQFCHTVLDLLDPGPEGHHCPPGLPGELARVIGAGVDTIADGMRQELAAWEGAIANVRRLLPARYLGPTPAVTALVEEMEATRAQAARMVGALDAFRDLPPPVWSAPPPVRPAPRPVTPVPPVVPTPVTDPTEPTAYELIAEPIDGHRAGPTDTVETTAGEPTREFPAPTSTERAADLFRQAQAHQKHQEFARAEGLYTDVIRLDPRFGPAYSRRGQLRAARGAITAALADFDAALQLDDTAAEAWWWRGDARAVAGRVDEAIADYTRALALRPDLVRARFNLGVALRQTGDTGRAVDAFTRVIEARPAHAGAYLNRGLTHLDRDDPGQAEHDFRTALRHDPGCELARRHLEAWPSPTALVLPSLPSSPPAPVAPAPTLPTPSRDTPASPPAPSTSGERAGLMKKEASHLTVNCPNCGYPGEVPWDRLGKVFSCGGCRRRFGVKSDGTAVELVNTPDGKWVEAPVMRERARLRRKRRLTVAGVVLMAVLFPAIAVAGWRVARGPAEVAERELPVELTARAELFAEAWLCNDVRLMRRLTSPANDRAVYAWYNRHRPPAALRSPKDGVPPEGARIEVTVRPGKPGQSVVRVRVSNPTSAPNQAPVDLSLVWEEHGDAWYLLPPAK